MAKLQTQVSMSIYDIKDAIDRMDGIIDELSYGVFYNLLASEGGYHPSYFVDMLATLVTVEKEDVMNKLLAASKFMYLVDDERLMPYLEEVDDAQA